MRLFLLVPLERAVFFLAGVVFDVSVFEEAVFADVVLPVAASADGDLCPVPLAGGSLAVEDESDWATAGEKKPRQGRKKNPTKTTTAKRRTQTLPTAGSWHP